ncbi:chemotaxis protein [Pseudoalteromonas sp. SSDWG2]|uniref:chemotaxis protein n=1 Tax=Pseudoalteromonas sp. SSDWG2 TaxID=3139391 RepID=UPI003BAC892E
MDFVNFRVGSKTISLKILDILFTERYEDNLTSLPNENPSFLGVKDYMDTPTPIFDLGLMLNRESTKSANSALAESIEQYMLLNNKWFRSLEDAVKQQQPMTNEFDEAMRKFINWYENQNVQDTDLKDMFKRLAVPHQHILEQAKIISGLTQDQAIALLNKEKRNTMALITRLLSSAKELLIFNHKPIIVYTTKDGKTPYIGLLVDRVEDSISVDQSDVKSLSELTSIGFEVDRETKHMMAGLIKLEDSHSLIIEPSAIFRPQHLSHEPEETEAYGLF